MISGGNFLLLCIQMKKGLTNFKIFRLTIIKNITENLELSPNIKQKFLMILIIRLMTLCQKQVRKTLTLQDVD